MQRLVLQKFDGGLGWETCNHLRNLLSKMFENAKKWGHFAGTNPALGVELPERRQVREKRVLMPEQAARLLAVLREPVRTMVQLAILTGLRVGEILALRWQDVDLNRGELRVVQAVYRGCMGSPKTKCSKRTIPLPQAVTLTLKNLKQWTRGVTSEWFSLSISKGREAVEKLSQMVTNGDEFGKAGRPGISQPTLLQ